MPYLVLGKNAEARTLIHAGRNVKKLYPLWEKVWQWLKKLFSKRNESIYPYKELYRNI